MKILDNFIILSLIIGAFFGGIKLSNWFHKTAEEHEKYVLRRQYLRLRTHMDADDPCQPYTVPPIRRRFAIPPKLKETLSRNGAATMRVEKQHE